MSKLSVDERPPIISLMSRAHLLLLLLLPTPILIGQPSFLDESFGANGIVRMELGGNNDVMRDLVVQPDGKILLGGYTSDNLVDRFCLIRLHPDGVPDESFGEDGIVVTDFPTASLISDIELLDDGSILAAGHVWTENAITFMLVKYFSDGQPDTAFGDDGIATADLKERHGFGRALTVQPDGRIVLAGSTFVSANDFDFITLIRFEANGQVDSSFGEAGIVHASFGPQTKNWAYSVALQSNGKIIAGGFSDFRFAMVRFHENGQVDETFGESGWSLTYIPESSGGVIQSLVIDPDDEIYAGGFFIDTVGNSTVLRFTQEGLPDSTYGDHGIVYFPFRPQNDGIIQLILQEDGQLLAGGQMVIDDVPHFILLKVTASGEWDTSFGQGGIIRYAIDPEVNFMEGIALQPDGKVLAFGFVGPFPYDVGVVRFSQQAVLTDEIELMPSLAAFPNPVTHHLCIAFPQGFDPVSWQVVDALGRKVEVPLISWSEQDQTVMLQLNVGSLSPGWYSFTSGMSTVPFLRL